MLVGAAQSVPKASQTRIVVSGIQVQAVEVASLKRMRSILEQADLWVTFSTLPNNSVVLGDLELVRFLRACDGDEAKATKLLMRAMHWRQQSRPGVESLQGLCPDQIAQLHAGGCYHHIDRHGRPIWLSKQTTDTNQMLSTPDLSQQCFFSSIEWRWSVLLPRISREQERPVGIIVIHDLDGVGFRFLRTWLTNTSLRQAVNEQTEIAQDYYPEVVEKVLVVNAPSIFPQLWKAVSWMLSPATQRKVVVIPKAETLATLRQYIPDEHIPACYLAGMPSPLACPLEQEFQQWSCAHFGSTKSKDGSGSVQVEHSKTIISL